VVKINFPEHTAWQEAGLTPREAEIVELIAQGYTDPEIAQELHCACSTVKFRMTRICEKLQVRRHRVVIARWWWENVERAPAATA
jgi:DNA-binding NarL/FixJ family response regulator